MIGLAIITAVITSHVHGRVPDLNTFKAALARPQHGCRHGMAYIAITAVVLP